MPLKHSRNQKRIKSSIPSLYFLDFNGTKMELSIDYPISGIFIPPAHTYQENNGEEVIRIISARKATKMERKKYEERNY